MSERDEWTAELWHHGWDIPTRIKLVDGKWYQNDAHGGEASDPVDPSRLVAAAMSEGNQRLAMEIASRAGLKTPDASEGRADRQLERDNAALRDMLEIAERQRDEWMDRALATEKRVAGLEAKMNQIRAWIAECRSDAARVREASDYDADTIDGPANEIAEDGGEDRTISISLDHIDLDSLEDEIARARQKAAVLRRTIGSSFPLGIYVPGGEDEDEQT